MLTSVADLKKGMLVLTDYGRFKAIAAGKYVAKVTDIDGNRVRLFCPYKIRPSSDYPKVRQELNWVFYNAGARRWEDLTNEKAPFAMYDASTIRCEVEMRYYEEARSEFLEAMSR